MSRLFFAACPLFLLAISASAHAGQLSYGTAWEIVDTDSDGIADRTDNAPYAFNPDQADSDNDFLGDITDPYLVQTNGDGDPVIDGFDSRPTDPTRYAISYGLGGPYIVSVGQTFSFSLSASDTSYTGYDRLALDIDSVSQAETYFLTPGDTDIVMVGGAGSLTPGTHLVGVSSFYNYDPSGGALETFASITVLAPEPTAASILAGGFLFSRRRRAV